MNKPQRDVALAPRRGTLVLAAYLLGAWGTRGGRS
jgi:hypothetical protein